MQAAAKVVNSVLSMFGDAEPAALRRPRGGSIWLAFAISILLLSTATTVSILYAQAAGPNTFVVISAGDAGGIAGPTNEGTLRQAINNANGGQCAAPCLIVFDDAIFATDQTIIVNTTSSGPLPAITAPNVTIDGYSIATTTVNTNPINQANNSDINVLISWVGLPPPIHGLRVDPSATGATIRGLAFRGGFTRAIELNSSGANIRGNYIGLDAAGGPSGTANINGVLVNASASGNTIGGTSPADFNIISGNSSNGIAIDGLSTTVLGNFIGTHKDGNTAAGNFIGVDVRTATTSGNNVIGTATVGNVISANGGTGVLIQPTGLAPNTIVRNNIIGLDRSGTVALGNGAMGIDVQSGSAQTIDNNVIAGNGVAFNGLGAPPLNAAQIRLTNSSTTTQLTRNVIGTNSGFTTSVAPANLGILVESVATNNQIGLSGQANSIGGMSHGVRIQGSQATGNILGGVVIGNAAATANVTGVYIHQSPGNTITAGNVISNNTGDGVVIDSDVAKGNRILGSVIRDNGGVGIDLDWTSNLLVPGGFFPGATPNDATDVDGGAGSGGNNLQNHPIISAATLSGGLVTANFSINSSGAAGTGSLRIEAFEADAAGTGSTSFLGGTCVGATFSGPLTFVAGSVVLGDKILATATNFSDLSCTTINDGTSEFSAAVVVATPLGVVTNTNDSGPGSLRQAILDANSGACVSPCTIAFNIPAPVPAGGFWTISTLTALPTIVVANVTINGFTQSNFMGDTNPAGPEIVINGSSAPLATNGLTINANAVTIRALAINNFSGAGIQVLSGAGSMLNANYLGINPTGTAAAGNQHGVAAQSTVSSLTIGTSPDPNVISGNLQNGILFQGTVTASTIHTNIIGLDRAGNVAVPNGFDGVLIDGGSGNVVGGLGFNVISGNGQNGIRLRSGGNNTIQNNRIGTNTAISAAIGNGQNGIRVESAVAPSSLIGGNSVPTRNFISGNAQYGIEVSGGIGTRIEGNRIGTTVTGAGALANGLGGIHFVSAANNNIVGGGSAAAGNVIAFNGGPGVFVELGAGNAIRRNSIHSNGGLGIDLLPLDVTPNDALDPDIGPNNLQNFPVLTSVSFNGVDSTVSGTFNSIPSTTFDFDFFKSPAKDPTGFGEGETYLGTSTFSTDPSGNANISIVVLGADIRASHISATATNTITFDTSEFAATVAADLSITKTDSPDPVIAGSPLTYTLTVTNSGPASASSVSVVDTLPASVTFVSAAGVLFTCSNAGNTVTCTTPTLGVGTSTITINVTAPTTAGTIFNSATVSAATPDPNTANNNTGAIGTTVAGSANLGITKIDSPDPVTVGSNVTFTINVTNAGPSAANNVTVTDMLPVSLTHVSSTSTQGSCGFTSPTVTCNLGTLANGGTATITLVATANTAGSVFNTANVSATESDPNTANNTATSNTAVNPPSADLSLTKSASPAVVTTGSNITYTLIASNAGPQSATNVTLTDTLPAGVVFVSATPSQGTCSQAAGVVTCPLGTVAVSGTATTTIVVTTTTAGTLTNNASVSGTESDPNGANNSAAAISTVNAASADLGITKSASPAAVTIGANITYSLVASNTGPQAATNVTVTDTLPAGVTFVSATASQGTCTQAGGVVTCGLGSLAVSGTATINIVVTTTTSGAKTNTASVSATEGDPNGANNSASATSTVNAAAADMAITKSAPASVLVGANINYTIGVSNAGPQPATNVTVTDTLPTGVTVLATTPSQGSCSQAGNIVTCNLGAVAVSGTASISIAVQTTTSGTKVNSASVTASEGDPNGANNSANTTTTVNALAADLAITKSATASVSVGQNIVYTLVVSNAGPQGSSNVTVLDSLPPGTTFVSASSTLGTCSQSGGVVTCSVGPLAVGNTATITITATAATAGAKTNTASVSGTETDANMANNSASATTTVIAPLTVNIGVQKTGTASVTPNENITYTILVKNDAASSGPATNVTMTDPIPANTTFVSVSTTQGSCTTTSPITCSIGTLAPGSSATVTLVVKARASGTVSNTASVTATEPDSITSNNSSSASTTVAAPPCTNPAPSLISPANNSTNVASPVTLSWTSVAGATQYKVFVGINEAPVERATLGAGATSLTITVPEGAVVDWFVQASGFSGACAATTSERFRFSTKRCELGVPQITEPVEGAGNVLSPVTVRWTAVSGATGYRVNVSDRGTATQTQTVTGTSATFTIVPGPVSVTVVALNAEGCESAPSATRNFNSTNCATPLIGPEIFAPGRISSTVPYPVSWKPVAGATRYEIQESLPTANANVTPNFSGVTRTVQGLSSLFVHDLGTSLTPVSYFYRVRAIIDCNNSSTPFSAIVNVDILPLSDPAIPFGGATPPLTGQVTFCTNFFNVFIPCGSKTGAKEIEGNSDTVVGANTTATVTTSVSWLTVTPATITIPPNGSATVTYTATSGGLPVGTSTGSVTATTPTGARSTNPVSISLVTPVTPTPKDAPSANVLIIPAIAHVDGIGSLWRSDVRITNTAAQAIRYALSFTPSSVDGTQEGKTTELSIGPGQTTALDDIVRTWYGQGSLGDGRNGTLEIRPLDFAGKIAEDAISFVTVASSRSYNKTANGTLGQYVPAIPFVSFVGKTAANNQAASLSVQQIVQNAAFRTNLGLVEGSGKEANVQLTVFNAAGQEVTSFSQLLKPFEHQQLNSFLALRNITLNDGRVEVKVLSETGKVMSYASVVDSVTNDPLLVPAVQASLINANKFVLPGVADFNNGTSAWRTDMRIFNATAAATTAKLTFYKQDDVNGIPRSIDRRIEAGEILVVNDILRQLFGMQNTGGAVHVTTVSNSALVVTGRTYDQRTSGTFGQFIPAVTEADAVGLGGRALQVQQLEETDQFRSNLGIAEVSGKSVTVEITAIVPDSLVAPRREITLQGNQFTQLTQVLRSLNLTDVYNGRIALRVIAGEGKITAYGSVVDNQTQDPTYVPAQ